MNAHALDTLTLLHVDLYRLRDPGELEHLGLRDWARPGSLWLVEWPEKGGGLLPPPDLTIHLSAGPQAHEADIAAQTSAGAHWLERIRSS